MIIKKGKGLGVFGRRGFRLEAIAPMVEHWIPNPRVVGSTPIGLTFYPYRFVIKTPNTLYFQGSNFFIRREDANK